MAQRQIGGEDQRAFLVALGHDLKEQIGLIAAERQIPDLIDDEQFWQRDRTIHGFAQPALALRRFQRERQIGGRSMAG